MSKLYTASTVSMFNSIPWTVRLTCNGKILVLDTKHHRVALNDNGTCTVEQFGSLKAASDKFKDMREMGL